MISLFSRSSTDNSDPIILALYKDPELVEKIETLAKTDENADFRNDNLQFLVISCSQEIIYILKEIQLHKISKDSKKIKPFAAVIPKLVNFFLVNTEYQQTAAIVLKCILALHIITDNYIQEQQLPFFITKICSCYSEINSCHSAIDEIFNILLKYSSIVQFICSVSFLNYAIENLFSKENFSYNASWFFRLFNKYQNFPIITYFDSNNYISQFLKSLQQNLIPPQNLSSFLFFIY